MNKKVKEDLKKHKAMEIELANSTFCLKKDLTSQQGRNFTVFERIPGTTISEIDTKDSQSSKSIKRKLSEDSKSDVNKSTKSAKLTPKSQDMVIPNATDTKSIVQVSKPLVPEPIKELTKSQRKKIRQRKKVKSKAIFDLLVSKGIVPKSFKDNILRLNCSITKKEYIGNIRQCVTIEDDVKVKDANETNIGWKIWINGTADHTIILNTQQVKDAIKKMKMRRYHMTL